MYCASWVRPHLFRNSDAKPRAAQMAAMSTERKDFERILGPAAGDALREQTDDDNGHREHHHLLHQKITLLSVNNCKVVRRKKSCEEMLTTYNC
jgi:hypothetical protein